MAARKLVAIAEVFRRNPEDGFEPEPGRMPAGGARVHPGPAGLRAGRVPGGGGLAADGGVAPGHPARRTLDALRDGIITRAKAELIVRLTQYLSDDEARAVEAKILGRAGRLTPGSLRSALARAVMEVAPEKARERREKAAKTARVERWAEDSGNAALMGRELPPDEVLAADQRISCVGGGAAHGRAGGRHGRAARPRLPGPGPRQGLPPPRPRPRAPPGRDGAAGAGPAPDTGPAGGAAGGFAGRVTLTVPLGTAAGLADRPGELAGHGPVDPWLARDLAAPPRGTRPRPGA